MGMPGSLPSLNSMSKSSREGPKDNPTLQIQNSEKVVSTNLNTNSALASEDITHTEGDRLEKVARKRTGGLNLHKIQTSKRRRLRSSSSNLSTKKEWPLTKPIEGPTNIPFPSDPGVVAVRKNSQDLAEKREAPTRADLAANREIFSSKREGSCRKAIFKKSNCVVNGGETGAGEREGSSDHQAAHSERAKSVGSLPSSRASESGEQLGSGNQSTPECRVLRPRRKITTTSQSSRVLHLVGLSLADYTRIIGRRIKVFWPIDAQWYYGWVKEYDAARKLHLVIYDDHEQEWLALQKEKFKLQVLPGETFGILGPTRSASSAAQSPDQPEVVSTRETTRRWNGVKDGSAIGDDLLLSAVVPRGRLGGKFRKGLSNGTSKAPFPRTDGIVKESASPVSSILRDKKRAGEVPAVGGKRENDGGAQTVPSNPIAEGQKTARKVEASVAENHMEENSILSRDACSDQAVKSNDVGDVPLGKSDLVYFRRHINRSKVRALLPESDVSRAQENPGLSYSVKCTASSVALGDGLLGAVGGSQQEQPVIVNGLQIQTSERASVVPVEGEVNRSETQCGRDMGNVAGVGDESCREANTAREKKQHIVSTTHSFSVNSKSPTSSPLTFHDADLAIFNDGTALWEEKISLGYRSRNVSLSADVKVLGNRVYPLNIATSPSLARGNANSLRHQSGLEFQQHPKRARASKARLNSSQLYVRRCFHSSLHLLRLDVVVLDVFTWQLFNILKEIGFCDGVSFEERFYVNGSLRDLVNIVRLLFTIIKAVPLSDWVHQTSPRRWQGRILWELWNVLSGTSLWFAELPGVVVGKVEGLLVRHLQHLIFEASSGSGMTFRQIFNVLVCYFIKPYVIATICEKGALVTVVIQRFLLSERSNSTLLGVIECVRQSVRAVRLRSGADGDLRFFSHLKYFPVSEDWCMENELSQKQVKTWIPTIACTRHAEQSSDKLFKQQGLQVTTAHVVMKKFGSDRAGNHFLLELNGDNVYRLLKSVLDRFRLHVEVKYWALNGRSGFHTNSCKPVGFFSGLILTSRLQKCLLSAGVKNLSSELSTENRICQINTNGGVPTEVVMSSLYKVGRIVSSDNLRMSVKDCRHGALQEDHAVEMETEARQQGFGSKLSVGKTGGKISANTEKNVADPGISARNTSSSMGYSMFGSVYDEGGMEINWLQSREDDGNQGSGKDTRQCPSVRDSFTCGSTNLSFERTLGPRSASGLEFRPQLNGDRCFDQRAKEPSIEPKMSSYQSHVLDRRKRKRGIPKLVSPAYNDVSHLGARRYGKRGRPSRQSRQDMVADQRLHYCCANLLITKGDRGWRESDVRVELQPSGSECLIVVQCAGDKFYAHKVQQMRLTSMTNCYTHARVWKGGTGWSLEFCDRKQWNLFKVLYEECGHQNARAASVKQIPIPGVRQIQDFDVTDLRVSPFVRPSLGYICQTDGEVEAAHKSTCIIYDMDSEDEAWLAEVNGNFDDRQHGSSNQRITEDCLEGIFDRLEKFTHTKAEELVSPDDAVEVCQDQGPADVVRAVYTHWCKKRLSKGTALVRQFQPPLWEQYDKQLQKWQASLNELQMHLPSASKEQLLERCPRPPMFAFCLRPRGLDASNMNKKMQKQRSQRKLSSVATTAMFAETAEESQRVQMFWPHRRQIHHHLTNSSTDPDWQPPSRTRLVIPARCIKPVWQNHALKDADHDQPVSGLNRQAAGLDSFTKAEEAQARAAEARERAGVKAGKSQRLYLKFDSALHRAVAALIEYEAIQFAEMALADEEAEVCSPPAQNEQLSDLKERVGHLSSQLSNLSEKSYDSGSVMKDESCGSLPDSAAAGHCDDGDAIYRVYSQNGEFEGSDTKHGFMGYSDALLPMPAWGHLDAWMGTTLLGRTDEGNTNEHIL